MTYPAVRGPLHYGATSASGGELATPTSHVLVTHLLDSLSEIRVRVPVTLGQVRRRFLQCSANFKFKFKFNFNFNFKFKFKFKLKLTRSCHWHCQWQFTSTASGPGG